MCSWNWGKLNFLDKEFILALEKTWIINIWDKWTYISLFSFHPLFPLEHVFMYSISLIQGVMKLYTEISEVNRKIKVHKKNMSRKHALRFDQWKTFFENFTPTTVWLWDVYKLPRWIVVRDFSRTSFKLKRGIVPL